MTMKPDALEQLRDTLRRARESAAAADAMRQRVGVVVPVKTAVERIVARG